ncbi:MAG TPA: indole-3-glycerol phosphate synthase TrpC [Acidimicrobiales bacterium]|nr:indole-3-glycerol phosphate synthase TrpC [Acidimicrobiales bacterium]
MTTYLDRILAAHRAAAADDDRDLDALVDRAHGLPPTRGFEAALERPGLGVIAEVKRRSPSKGDLRPDLDPAAVARAYERGGAACLSVLTDREFFGGSPEDLAAARAAVSLPVLRKDFTVSAHDVCDARLMGADAVLLIVAALDDHELAHLHSLAIRIGLDALVEVHDADELNRALEVGATLIGVNQRDLVTFEVDRRRAASLRPIMPGGTVSVAESGVGGPDDAAALRVAGYDAVLVGESVVTADDPEVAVRALASA